MVVTILKYTKLGFQKLEKNQISFQKTKKITRVRLKKPKLGCS